MYPYFIMMAAKPGTNLYSWGLKEIQSLGLFALLIIGIVLVVQRKLSKIVGLIGGAVVMIFLIFNTSGAKDVLLNFGNMIFK